MGFISAHRHSCANNIYLNEHSDNERNKYLMYFNVNNVYVQAISKYCGFKWMTDEKTEHFYVCKTSNSSKYRYILEDDLEYPENFNKIHDNHPLALQKIYKTGNMLDPYCKKLFLKNLYITTEKEKKADTNL